MGRTIAGRGFTLIELLIVVAIIAILAAILFPIFATAQRSAERTQCLNNQKQILNGIIQYAQDNAGRMPPGYERGAVVGYNWSTGNFGLSWHERVFSYVRNRDVFRCPAIPKAVAENTQFFSYSKFPTTYGMNWRMCSNGGIGSNGQVAAPYLAGSALVTAGVFGVTVAADTVRMPSKVILICESQHLAERVLATHRVQSARGGGGKLVYSDTGSFYWEIRWLNNPYLPRGHDGGANFGMVDGHVQFVKAIPPSPKPATSIGTPPAVSSAATAGLMWW